MTGTRRSPESASVAELLDFEAAWPKQTGAKERAMRLTFGTGPARYYAALNHALDEHRAAALQHDPITVHRLLELRAKRTTSRHTRILGRTPNHEQR